MQNLARRANDYMAKEVAKNPKRFAGFCVLSMHDPSQAAQELRRSVTELGLKGAIINDFQSAGADGETMLMYDQPEYDPFWAAVQVCLICHVFAMTTLRLTCRSIRS